MTLAIDRLKLTECIGMILKNGLPPLGSAPAEISVSVSLQKSVTFQSSDGTFDILQNLPAIERSSSLWQRFNKQRWSNPSIDTNKIDRTDLAIIRTGYKKPPNSKQKEEGEEFDIDNIGQIVQYMYDLRCRFGLRYTFGVNMGVITPVVKLLEKHALLMPFAFHIRHFSDKLQ